MLSDSLATFAVYVINIDQGELIEVRYPPSSTRPRKNASPIAQLVRAPH